MSLCAGVRRRGAHDGRASTPTVSEAGRVPVVCTPARVERIVRLELPGGRAERFRMRTSSGPSRRPAGGRNPPSRGRVAGFPTSRVRGTKGVQR